MSCGIDTGPDLLQTFSSALSLESATVYAVFESEEGLTDGIGEGNP